MPREATDVHVLEKPDATQWSDTRPVVRTSNHESREPGRKTGVKWPPGVLLLRADPLSGLLIGG